MRQAWAPRHCSYMPQIYFWHYKVKCDFKNIILNLFSVGKNINKKKNSIKWSQGKSKPQEEAATYCVWLHKGFLAGLEPFKPSSLRMWNSSPETLPVDCAFITDAEYWTRARLPASLLGDHRLAPHLQLCQSLCCASWENSGAAGRARGTKLSSPDEKFHRRLASMSLVLREWLNFI